MIYSSISGIMFKCLWVVIIFLSTVSLSQAYSRSSLYAQRSLERFNQWITCCVLDDIFLLVFHYHNTLARRIYFFHVLEKKTIYFSWFLSHFSLSMNVYALNTYILGVLTHSCLNSWKYQFSFMYPLTHIGI